MLAITLSASLFAHGKPVSKLAQFRRTLADTGVSSSVVPIGFYYGRVNPVRSRDIHVRHDEHLGMAASADHFSRSRVDSHLDCRM